MITKDTFSLQISKIATLWEDADPRERVYFLGEVPTERGLRLSVIYCSIGSIPSLNEDWVLINPQGVDHGLPRLRRNQAYQSAK